MRRRRLFQLLTLLIIPPILIVGGIVYIKLFGFRKALEELVDTRTNGEYALTFEESHVNLRHLTFTFKGLTIQRNPGVIPRGIKVVWIPSMKIDFASLPKMLALEKIRIKSLTIEEPEIQIDGPPNGNKAQKLQGEVQLTQQIVRLYPAIESLLSSFDITSLSVTRASLELRKGSQSSLRLNLIDLLVEHWDIQQIDDKSQLLLKVEGQSIDLGKAQVDFGSIEFNFKQHHLVFTDFKVNSMDTVSGSQVSVTGKSAMLQNLNYKELYDNQRFVLQRAQVDNPVVEARFRLKTGKRSASRDKNLISRLLRQVVGECYIDSTIIYNARIRLTLQQDKDSVKIELPDVDFKLHSFGVQEGNTDLLLGEIETSLHKSSISLRNHMSISCEKIYFDANRNLTFTDLAVADRHRTEITRIGKIHIEAFDALAFVFNKTFYANRIAIENTSMRITPRDKSKATAEDQAVPIRDFHVRDVTFRNVDLSYTDENGHYTADGVSMGLADVRYDSTEKLRYLFKTLRAASASANQPANKLDARLAGLSTDGRRFLIDEFTLLKDSIKTQIKSLKALAHSDVMSRNFTDWDSLTIASLDITAVLPATKKDSAQKKAGLPFFHIAVLTLDKINAHVRKGDRKLTMAGDAILWINLSHDSTGLEPGTVNGTLKGLSYTTQLLSLNVATMNVNYPEGVKASRISYKKGNVSVDMVELLASNINPTDSSLNIETIVTRNVTAGRADRIAVKSDSVLVSKLRILPGAAPDIKTAEIFRPTIRIFENKDRTVNRRAPLSLPAKTILHAGILHLPGDREIEFGRMENDRDLQQLTCEYLRTSMKKMDLDLMGVVVTRDAIDFDSIAFTPRRQWFDTCKTEDTQVNLKLRKISMTGHSMDSMLRARSLRNVALTIGDFDLTARRDKRMIDAPSSEKPFTLNDLINLPPSLKINSVDIKNGTIRYNEVSDKTGEEGWISMTRTSARLKFHPHTDLISLTARTSLYDAGTVDLSYKTLDSCTFQLTVKAADLDLPRFNKIILPLEAVRIKSGTVKEFNLMVTADSSLALGRADITYKKLHLEIFKRGAPEKRTFGTELLSLLADKVVLRHKKVKAPADVRQPRFKNKSIFNFWVKSAVNGASGAIRHRRKN